MVVVVPVVVVVPAMVVVVPAMVVVVPAMVVVVVVPAMVVVPMAGIRRRCGAHHCSGEGENGTKTEGHDHGYYRQPATRPSNRSHRSISDASEN